MSKISKMASITMYKGILFVMLKVLKVLYTYMNRMHIVASLLFNSNFVNM